MADSLLQLLRDPALNDILAFEIHRKLGFNHPNPSSALTHSLEALRIANKTKDKLNKLRALEVLGLGHRLLGNKSESYLISFQALSLADSLKLPKKQAALHSQIASNFVNDEIYQEAILSFKRSLDLFTDLDDQMRSATVWVNMGEAYRLANILDSAALAFEEALEINQMLNSPVIEAYSLGNLGMTHHAQGKLDEALPELAKAVEMLNELGDPASVVIYEAEIGQVLIKQGQEEEGVNKIVSSFELAKSENLKEQIKELSGMLTKLYSERSAFDQAYFYQQQYQIYQDSLVNPASIREIEQAKSDYEMNKQQQEADVILAATQKKIAYVFFVVVLLALLVGTTYYAYIGKKKANYHLSLKNKVIGAQILEKELLHKEMHHRVKNNLQLISSIMGLHADEVQDKKVSNAIAEGKSRMEAMTLIHQKLYGKEEASFIEIGSYLDNLIDNLKSTYSGQIADIKLDALALNVEADDSIPIGLIVNEAVCNAAKYGKDGSVLVEVSLKNTGASYELKISDNGPGFPEKEMKPGFGTMLISTLAKQLRAKLEVINLSPGTAIVLNFENLKLGRSMRSLNNVPT